MIIVMTLVKLPGECPYKKDGVLAVPSGGTTGLKNSTVGAFGVPFMVPKKKKFHAHKTGSWFLLTL